MKLGKMNYKKVLTLLSFVVGAIFFLFFFSYILESNPGINELQITNLTSNSATITWVSDSETIPSVQYSLDNNWPVFVDKLLPKSQAFDDRDLTLDSNKNLVYTSSISLTRTIHHVTIRNLEAGKKYFFRINGKVRTFVPTTNEFTTLTQSDKVAEPDPIYGKVINYATGGINPTDGVIYYKVVSKTDKNKSSATYSAVVGKDFAWAGDLSNIVDKDGNVFKWDKENFRVQLDSKTNQGYGLNEYDLTAYKPIGNAVVNVRYSVSSVLGIASDIGLDPVQKLSAGSAIVNGVPICQSAYPESCGDGCNRDITCGPHGEFRAGACTCSAPETPTCPVATIWNGSTCVGTAEGTHDETVSQDPVGGGGDLVGDKPDKPDDPSTREEANGAFVGSGTGSSGGVGSSTPVNNPATPGHCDFTGIDCPPAPGPLSCSGVGPGQVDITSEVVNENSLRCNYQLYADTFSIFTAVCNKGTGVITRTTATPNDQICATVQASATDQEQGVEVSANSNTTVQLESCPEDGRHCQETSDASQNLIQCSTNETTSGFLYCSATSSNPSSNLPACPTGNAECYSTDPANGQTYTHCFNGLQEGYCHTPTTSETCSANITASLDSFSCPAPPTCPGEGAPIVSMGTKRVQGDSIICVYPTSSNGQIFDQTITIARCSNGGVSANNSAPICLTDAPQGFKFSPIKKVHAQPIPDVIDPEKLSKGTYTIFIPGYKNAEFAVYNNNVTMKYFEDTNGDGIKQADEQYVDLKAYTVTVSKLSDLTLYRLQTGWNLIALNFISTGFDTASDLAKEINRQGVNAVQISKYDNGNWIHYVYRVNEAQQAEEFGNDFTLVPGEGYFVRTINPGIISLKGQKFTSSVPINLNLGWNLASIESPTQYKAIDFINKCQTDGALCTTISRFQSGVYESVVQFDNKFFGNDFDLNDTEGYFVLNTSRNTTISP
ncbi:MAG: fibronectin type III domain-containing protein [Candidatus Dojkabacteria bacterium]